LVLLARGDVIVNRLGDQAAEDAGDRRDGQPPRLVGSAGDEVGGHGERQADQPVGDDEAELGAGTDTQADEVRREDRDAHRTNRQDNDADDRVRRRGGRKRVGGFGYDLPQRHQSKHRNTRGTSQAAGSEPPRCPQLVTASGCRCPGVGPRVGQERPSSTPHSDISASNVVEVERCSRCEGEVDRLGCERSGRKQPHAACPTNAAM
jgi:hypothetical protein